MLQLGHGGFDTKRVRKTSAMNFKWLYVQRSRTERGSFFLFPCYQTGEGGWMRRGRKKKEMLSERRNWVKEVRERWRRKGSDHSLNRYSTGHTAQMKW